MRACVLVLKERIIPIVPESDPLRAKLQAIVDDTFLELPEDGRIWRKFYFALCAAIPEGESNHQQWHKDVIRIWKEETCT